MISFAIDGFVFMSEHSSIVDDLFFVLSALCGALINKFTICMNDRVSHSHSFGA